ncbi:uncharacterized protein STEHIDRAFT_153381 [Stereum hirsutum FP-91666 SS1]|uniref:uncharacterized protein n=1 Tax=Stereum hirsutum (strain FP-91666) TaxID=721885 RepID=UPI00044102BC|nr:uncharacterized protein STEHIDRAFT_153381 [Stereum hirsutum FP-91666 SS1]EIM89519.1 hypothetical protein STEHIDRAFT_153381 [Stereum hirsutum FP-91666 SS1]
MADSCSSCPKTVLTRRSPPLSVPTSLTSVHRNDTICVSHMDTNTEPPPVTVQASEKADVPAIQGLAIAQAGDEAGLGKLSAAVIEDNSTHAPPFIHERAKDSFEPSPSSNAHSTKDSTCKDIVEHTPKPETSTDAQPKITTPFQKRKTSDDMAVDPSTPKKLKRSIGDSPPVPGSSKNNEDRSAPQHECPVQSHDNTSLDREIEIVDDSFNKPGTSVTKTKIYKQASIVINLSDPYGWILTNFSSHQTSTDSGSDVQVISDSGLPIPRKRTRKVKSRSTTRFTSAQIARFKKQGSKDDPISIDMLESGSEAEVVATIA